MEKFREWYYLNKIKIFLFLILIFIIGIIIGCLFYFSYRVNNNSIVNDIPNSEVKEKENKVIEDKKEKILVDVKGAVNNPGVYIVSIDSRVNDALKLAGIKNNADLSIINLSKKVFDEMVIIVYTKNEVNNFIKTKEELKEKIENCKENNSLSNDACLEKKDIDVTINDKQNISNNFDNNNKLISLNNASLEELMTLTGIGESKANTIIEYRNTKPFENIEELKNIKGIGESIYEKIKDYITL